MHEVLSYWQGLHGVGDVVVGLVITMAPIGSLGRWDGTVLWGSQFLLPCNLGFSCILIPRC